MKKRVLLGTIRNAKNKNLRLNSVGESRLIKPRLTEDKNVNQNLHYNPENIKACGAEHNPNLKRHLAEMVQNKPIKYRALSSKIPGSNYSAEIGKVRYKIPKRKNMTLNNIEKEPEIGKGGPGSGRVDEDGDLTNNPSYRGSGKTKTPGTKPKSNFGRNLLAGAGTALAVGGLLNPVTRGFAARALSRGGARIAQGASKLRSAVTPRTYWSPTRGRGAIEALRRQSSSQIRYKPGQRQLESAIAGAKQFGQQARQTGLKATRPLRSRIRYAMTPQSVIDSRRIANISAGAFKPPLSPRGLINRRLGTAKTRSMFKPRYNRADRKTRRLF